MFSAPVSNAIGENATYKEKPPRRDEDGEVITDPRNFYTGKGVYHDKMKNRTPDDIYFLRPTYVATGDPFKMAALNSMARTEKKDGHIKAGHEKNFSPSKRIAHIKGASLYSINPITKANVEYMEEKPPKVKNRRDADGEVITEPKGFLTNPMKVGSVACKGNIYLGGNIEYMTTDYNVNQKLARQEREYHESKI